MTPGQADAAVARGAAVLDDRGPAGWRGTVRAAIRDGLLDMGDPECCVLGHLYGGYGRGWGRLVRGPWQVTWSVRHGFSTNVAEHAVLAAAWARLLGAEVGP